MTVAQKLIGLSRGAAAFTPTALSGIVAWYDFSDITTLWKDTARTSAVTADADVIKGVTDKSGAGHHLSEATNGPTYKAAIQNSRSIARFNGSSSILTSSSVSFTSPLLVFAAHNLVVSPSAQANLVGQVGTFFGFGQAPPANARPLVFWGSNHVGTTYTENTWHAFLYQENGASSVIYMDNTIDGTGPSSSGTFSWTNLAMTVGGANARFLQVDLGEVIICQLAASSTDRGNAFPYLKTRWGTP